MTDASGKPLKTSAAQPGLHKDSGDRNGCRRCGTCCRKGGPALHMADIALVKTGAIALDSLFTIRAGERVHDNVCGRVVPLKTEIVKIRGRANSWSCLFYDSSTCGCRIYDQRPLECRALACWNTSELVHIYKRHRITRKDLIGNIRDLWDLVQTHESRCAYEKLSGLISQIKTAPDQYLADAVCECIAYDRHLRELTVEKSGMTPGLLDFLFGRPLQETVSMYGITVFKSGSRLQLRFKSWQGESL